MPFNKFPERSVKNYLNEWIAQNGTADPRPMLDSYFWSYIDRSKRYYGSNMIEMDTWCNNTLGEENWHRLFNKYWFTSQEDFLLFTLTWGGEQNISGTDMEFL